MGIDINNVSKKLGNFQLKDLNFSISDGEYFVLLGPSGSGKTKTIELIAGLITPDSGTISGVDGQRVGLIYQDYMLFPHLNVFKNIAYGLRFSNTDKNEIKRKVDAVSEEFGISGLLDKNIAVLSGGEKQRVSIARATVISPGIYIFDEPTSALDRNLKEKTRKLFKDLHKKTKKTFIHVTHDFEIALALADKIGIIFNGKIVQSGTPDQIFCSPVSKDVADFLGYRNVLRGEIKGNIFRNNGVSLMVNGSDSLLSYIAIRADDIFLSEKKFSSSARNSFRGEVEEIVKKSSVVEVTVNVGFPLSVDITRKSFNEMKIQKGKKLWVTFKVSSVKVFEH